MRDAGGIWHDVAKAPATDPGKASKAGRQAVVLEAGRLVARKMDSTARAENLMRTVWRNGTMLVRHSFEELRERAT
jgi:nicotinamide phosphoribosyltransferase